MPAAPPIPQKTPLGVEAQRKRTADLGQRHRTILFLIDGRRTLSEVLALATQAGAATTHFEDLVRLGYIEVPQPDFPSGSQAMPLDETEAIADSLEIDVPPPPPLLLGEDAVVPADQLPPPPAPAVAPPPAPMIAPAPAPVASTPPPAPSPPTPPPAPQRPAVVARSAVAPMVEPRPAAKPSALAAALSPKPAPPRAAPEPKAPPRAAPAPAPKPVPKAAPVPVPAPAVVQPKAAKVRAPTIISSHGLAPAGKPTAPGRSMRVIPPATHDEDDVLGEVRACLLETVRIDGAAFGKRMVARVKSAAEPSDFIGLVWELERETSHARRSREGLWNLQRARELLGLGNTLVAEDSRPNWPDSE